MGKLELIGINCKDLAGLSGFDIQCAFEKADRFALLAVEYPKLPVRSMLLIAPSAHVMRFFKPKIAEACWQETGDLIREYEDRAEGLLASLGIDRRSLAPIAGIVEDTIFENRDWEIPISIKSSYMHERFVEEFAEYVSEWLLQLSNWVACAVEPNTLSSSEWYYERQDEFLGDRRLRAFGAMWKLVPGEGWHEMAMVSDAISEEIISLGNGDDSIRTRLKQSPTFTQRDLDRTAIINSVLPSKRLVCQLRPGQTVAALMRRFDETLLLRAQFISRLDIPLSYFCANEIIDGVRKSISRAPEHESPCLNEAIAVLQQFRESQESMYPILKRVFGG